MQTMSDKEFDKQFRDKFENFESEPSAFIWGNIDRALTISGKKSFPWFKVAAASIAAIITAGIWLAPQKQPMKLYGKAKTEQREIVVEDQAVALTTPVEAGPKIENVEAEQAIEMPVRAVKAKVKRALRSYPREEELATVIQKPELINQPLDALQEESVSAAAPPSISEEVFFRKMASEQVLALNSLPDDGTGERSKHKIRSVGDLVNFVVSKVDKRKNKIIEFSRDDEGEEISGLNLGVLQYRTRNN